MIIRTLTKADLPQILQIENAVHIVPWTEDTFRICFQPGYRGWVMETDDKKIVGFILVSCSKDECHVLNLCVAHAHQGQGIGTRLLEYSITCAHLQGVSLVYLEVRKSNSRAITLYRKLQFHLIGERKNYYPTVNGQEDALIFVKSLHNLSAIPCTKI